MVLRAQSSLSGRRFLSLKGHARSLHAHTKALPDDNCRVGIELYPDQMIQ